MTEQEIRTILNTLSRKFRAEQLGKLKASLQRHEEELNAALQQDLGKSRMESYMCEIGLTLSELTWMQKHLRGLMQEKRVPTPLSQFAAISFRSPSPYGTVLIMSPWCDINHEPLELPDVTDAGSADRCHSCRKYGGGEAQCICSGDGSCAEKYSGRMFSDRIRGCDHRRQSRESGIIAAAV